MAVVPGRIVVPLDGSSLAQHVIPYAGRLARATGAMIEFVLVVDDNDDAAAHATEAFTRHCDSLAQTALPEGVGHTVTVLRGSPAKMVLQHAEGARMIAMATHGLGGLKATVVGSVADKIVRGATVPVFLLPGPKDEPPVPGNGPVLVGVDGSEEALQGLHAARELAADLGGASVAVMRAYTMPAAVGTEFAYYPPDMLESFEQAAKEYLAEVANPGEKTYLVNGNAAQALEEVADQIDAQAVVVTSHGKSFMSRIALGSTTDRLMHALTRPMYIVPLKEG